MLSVSKIIVLFSVALSVTAMPSHFARNPRSHHGLAARVASPELIAEPVPIVEQRPVLPPLRRRKRSLSGRCATNPSSVPASSSTLVSANTPDPSSTLVVKLPASIPNPETSTSPKYTPTSSSSAAPPKSSDNSSGGGLSGLLAQTFSGDGTWYGTGLGACGITNNDSDMIAAVSEQLFDTFPGYVGGNPNLNPICGYKVSVTYGGTTIIVTITDRCVACAYGALDFSPTAFDKLADSSLGRLHDISWHFI